MKRKKKAGLGSICAIALAKRMKAAFKSFLSFKLVNKLYYTKQEEGGGVDTTSDCL